MFDNICISMYCKFYEQINIREIVKFCTFDVKKLMQKNKRLLQNIKLFYNSIMCKNNHNETRHCNYRGKMYFYSVKIAVLHPLRI